MALPELKTADEFRDHLEADLNEMAVEFGRLLAAYIALGGDISRLDLPQTLAAFMAKMESRAASEARTDVGPSPRNQWSCGRCHQNEQRVRGLSFGEEIPLHALTCLLRGVAVEPFEDDTPF